jgi:hypothetical protein
MEPSLDQLIQSLKQITQHLKDLECVFGSSAAIYSQRKTLQRQSVVELEANAASTNEED